MTHDRDDRHPERPDENEPSLKDALMPEKNENAETREPTLRRDTYGEPPSLKDALLPEDHQPSPPPTAPEPEQPEATAPEKKAMPTAEPVPPADVAKSYVVQSIVGLALVVGFVVVFFVGRMSNAPLESVPEGTDAGPVGGAISQVDANVNADTPGAEATASTTPPIETRPTPPQAPTPTARVRATPDWGDPGPMSLAAIQEQKLIIDVHEHIESLEEAPLFLEAMDALGIQKMCLMGSSKFTLTLNEDFGFTKYDENNEELIKIIEAYPGRFEAWPTIDPTDPDKLEKIQGLVERGATGVKLYIGHGYVAKDNTYMFHTTAMDDPGMLPFYAWCEERGIPLAFHVNPYKDKKGFAQEFIAVLTQYPDLKVIAPHFILSSVKSSRMEELLDTFPNLYSDISFGDYFMKQRLTYMSKYPKKFQAIFNKYPDRFMFASDLVMIKGRSKDWAPTQLKAYIDMLTKKTYTTEAIPGETLNGLALSDEIVSRVLFRNYLEFRVRQPQDTKITREIDWKRMNVEPVDRKPGQAFPPKPKSR